MSDEEKKPAKTKGIIAIAATALVGGGAAFGVSWLDPFGGDAHAEVAMDEKPDAMMDKPAAILALDPLVVSLTGTDGARRRAPRLRVVIALETNEDIASHTDMSDPRLRDGFIAAARALGAEALAGPEGLETLRAAFLVSARETLGEAAVSGVLVTDYVIT